MTSIDTLYYQWVVTEEDKKVPTIFEDIADLSETDKINDLLNTYAAYVAQLIEAEVNQRAMLDDYVQRAKTDPELAEADDDEIARAINELEPVQEGEADVETQRNALDMLHDSLVKVFAGEE